MALIGRARQQVELAELLASTARVFVRGPEGVGKTALVASVLADSARSHARTAGVDLLEDEPHLLAKRLLARAPRDVGAAARDVAALVGWRLLVVDDVQWIDDESVALLDALPGPILVIGRSAPERLLASATWTVFDVEPLADRDARALAEAALGDQAALASLVAVAAAGRPGAILALADDPARLADLVARRVTVVDELPEPARADLALLAVVGAPLPAELVPTVGLLDVAGLARQGDGRAAPVADSLARAVLERLPDDVVEAARRRALAEDLGPAVWAAQLEALGEEAEAHALALLAAETATGTRRLELLVLAARTAAPADREDSFRRAADALLHAKEYDRCRQLLAEAEQRLAGLPPRLVVRLSTACLAQGEHDRAVELLAPLRAAPELSAVARAEVAGAAAAAALLGTGPGAAPSASVAAPAEVAVEPDGAATVADEMLQLSGRLILGAADWEAPLAMVIDTARELELPAYVALGRQIQAIGLVGLDRRDDAAAILDEALNEFATLGPDDWLQETLVLRAALIGTMSDDSSWALDDLRAQLPTLPRGLHSVFGLGAAAVLSADRGLVPEADDWLARAGAEAINPLDQTVRHWAGAEVRWSVGDLAGAADHLRGMRDEAITISPSWAHTATLVGWVRVDLGTDGADLDVPDLEAVHPLTRVAGTTEELHGALALAAGDLDRARRLLAEAQLLHEGQRDRHALRCLWGRGEAELRAGAEAARATLQEARRRAERADQRMLLGRIRASERRLGAGSRAPRVSAIDRDVPVTGREEEVLGLVAEGLTTAEIATRLRLSRSAVDASVASARAKLGARTRVEAAAIVAARRRGLSDAG